MNKTQIMLGMLLVLIMSNSEAKSLETVWKNNKQQFKMTQSMRREIKNSCGNWSMMSAEGVLNKSGLKNHLISVSQRNHCLHRGHGSISTFGEKVALKASYLKMKVQRVRMKPKVHVFAVRKPKRVKLSCQGSKADGWHIRLNLNKKRMWVNLKNVSAFSAPITYFRWRDDKRKHLKVIAGKGKKQVNATLDGSKLCRLDFSKRQYAYSINAKVARTTHLSGCCSDISP